MRAVLLIGVLAIGVPDRPDRSPMPVKPQSPVFGDWQDVGQANFILRLSPGESIFLVNGQVSNGDSFTANCVFDLSKTPIHIDFMPKNGNGKIEGILKVEGDRLTLATGSSNQRPIDFVGSLYHYRRARP